MFYHVGESSIKSPCKNEKNTYTEYETWNQAMEDGALESCSCGVEEYCWYECDCCKCKCMCHGWFGQVVSIEDYNLGKTNE